MKSPACKPAAAPGPLAYPQIPTVLLVFAVMSTLSAIDPVKPEWRGGNDIPQSGDHCAKIMIVSAKTAITASNKELG